MGIKTTTRKHHRHTPGTPEQDTESCPQTRRGSTRHPHGYPTMTYWSYDSNSQGRVGLPWAWDDIPATMHSESRTAVVHQTSYIRTLRRGSNLCGSLRW